MKVLAEFNFLFDHERRFERRKSQSAERLSKRRGAWMKDRGFETHSSERARESKRERGVGGSEMTEQWKKRRRQTEG